MRTSPATTESGGERSGAELAAGIRSFLEQSGVDFCAADIFCLGWRVADRVRAIVEALLALKDAEDRSGLELNLVVPEPTVASLGGPDALQAEVEQLFAAGSMGDAASPVAGGSLRVIQAPNLRADTVIPIVGSAPPRSVVIVVDAASFRDESVQPYRVAGGEAPMLLEDFWVPHLHALGKKLVEVAKGRGVYVVLDAGYPSPHQRSLRDLLESIDGVGVLASEMIDDPEAVLSAKAEEWNRLLSEGHLAAVLRSIDALPASMDSEKPFLRIQMFHRAGLHAQALEAIENASGGDDLNPSALVKLAKVSADAGAGLFASRFLNRAADDLKRMEDLELALTTAADIQDGDLQERIARRFERLFPGSSTLRRRRSRALEARGEYAAAAVSVDDQQEVDVKERYRFLSAALGKAGVPDYVAIWERLEAGKVSWAPEAYSALIEDALRRGLIVHALDLALSKHALHEQSPRHVHLVLKIIERLLIDREPGGQIAVGLDRLKAAVVEVVRYLSAHPTDGVVRVRLARLLSVDVSGSLGLALLAAAVIDLMRNNPPSLRSRPAGRNLLPKISSSGARSLMAHSRGWNRNRRSCLAGWPCRPRI